MTNKILFWIFTDLLYFGMANFFQNPENKLYAIHDVTNTSKKYLQNQNIVKFSKEWFYHDHLNKNIDIDIEYLKSFEIKYDVNLWRIAYNERVFFDFNDFYKFSKNEILSILQQECKLFEKILDEVNPDNVVMPTPNFHHDYLFYKICKVKKINIHLLNYARLGKKSVITSEIDKITSLESQDFTKPVRTQEQLLSYLKKYDYSKNNTDFNKTFMSSKTKLFKAVFHYLFVSDNNSDIYTYNGRTKINVLLKMAYLILCERLRYRYNQKYFTKILKHNEKFIYFPLQVEPENSILLGSPYHTNQLEVIKNICKSLPIDYKLYVKEHPTMEIRGWRSISFYKTISELPNASLLHPTIENEEILKNCSAVISISSTAAMEAAFYGKPSIVFTEVLYSMLQSVHKLSNIDLLSKTILSILDEKVDFSDVNKYVNFIDYHSINFDIFEFTSKLNEHLFYGGYLQDVTITDNQMQLFLDQNKGEFEFLVDEHIKKFIPNHEIGKSLQ